MSWPLAFFLSALTCLLVLLAAFAIVVVAFVADNRRTERTRTDAAARPGRSIGRTIGHDREGPR